HNFSTSPKIVQSAQPALSRALVLATKRKIATFRRAKKRYTPDEWQISICGKESTRKIQIRESAACRTIEFVNSNRISTDDQAIFQDQNHVCFEPRVVRRVNQVRRATVSVLVEAQQRVTHCHPYFSGFAIDANCRQDSLEGRRVATFFLSFNLAAQRLGFRH